MNFPKKATMDGDWWQAQSILGSKHGDDIEFIVKSVIVSGIFEGLIWGKSPIKDDYEFNTTVGEMVRALDQFYNDDRNLKIPIAHALRFVSGEMRGASQEAIDKVLIPVRKLFEKATDNMDS